MGAYDDVADIYAAGGLWPIPVLGKALPVKGATGYQGTVTTEKVATWTHPDPVVRARAGRGVGMDNVGLRHDLTLAVDVDEGYGGKDGVAQLATFAEQHGLPPLPATWSSTARGDDAGSRQYVYRIAERARFNTKPCEAVELCCWHHRYTVCAPSVHPGTGAAYAWYLPGAAAGVPPTWGARTDRFPRLDAFAELPAEWFEVFKAGAGSTIDRAAAVVELPELLAAFPQGEPDGLIRHLTAKWSDPGRHVGHEEFKGAAIHALMLGREGHVGVGGLLTVLWERFTAYLAAARPGVAAREATNLLAACADIAQRKPLTPRTFFGFDVDDLVARDAAHPGPAAPPAAVTDDTVDAFLATFTTYRDPHRLARRCQWMKADPPVRLSHHAAHLVHDAINGCYPADRAVRALLDGHRHHGITDPDTTRAALKLALDVVLHAKASA